MAPTVTSPSHAPATRSTATSGPGNRSGGQIRRTTTRIQATTDTIVVSDVRASGTAAVGWVAVSTNAAIAIVAASAMIRSFTANASQALIPSAPTAWSTSPNSTSEGTWYQSMN